MLLALVLRLEVRDFPECWIVVDMIGFRNCLFSFYGNVSGGNSELFTTIHSLYSFFDGFAILSVGPVGTALNKLAPEVMIEDYAIGKYVVSSSTQLYAESANPHSV